MVWTRLIHIFSQVGKQFAKANSLFTFLRLTVLQNSKFVYEAFLLIRISKELSTGTVDLTFLSILAKPRALDALSRTSWNNDLKRLQDLMMIRLKGKEVLNNKFLSFF